MVDKLAARVGDLANLGWNLKSQTETTAWLEQRRPINWWLFFFFLIFFFIFGALIYLIVWSLADKMRLYLAIDKDGAITQYGDLWLLQKQEANLAKAIEATQQIKERGWWRIMWPSVVITIVIFGLWIWLFWWIFSW